MGWPLGWGNSARCAPNYLVNIAARQSLAVRSAAHVPVVFDQPARFTREAFYEERDELNRVAETGSQSNGSRDFLLNIARSAQDASGLVRQAWENYSSPIDYGVNNLDLPKVVSLIDAGMPPRSTTFHTETMPLTRMCSRTMFTAASSPTPPTQSRLYAGS